MDLTATTPPIENASEPCGGAEMQVPFETQEECLIGNDCLDLLREAGLRPTYQRLVLGGLLFSKGGRHVTADMLYTEATSVGIQISRATVYNTLNQFTDAGLLRQIGIDGSKRSEERRVGKECRL